MFETGHSTYSKKPDELIMMHNYPGHINNNYVFLFEAKILMDYYLLIDRVIKLLYRYN